MDGRPGDRSRRAAIEAALTLYLLRQVRKALPLDVVCMYSPPLTLGLLGIAARALWRVPFVFHVQDMLPQDLVADLPPSSFSTVTWDGNKLGVVFTLSLLTLFYNSDHLQQAGLSGPPIRWT